MDLQEPTLFAKLPESCPTELAKRTVAWSDTTKDLLRQIGDAETAIARRAKALAGHERPAPEDRGAPRLYREGLEALQEHLATLGPLRDAVAEALHKALQQATAGAAKTVANLAGRLVTLGFSEEDARVMAAKHPDARALALAAKQLDGQLCAMPNPKGGSVPRLAAEVDNRLATLEAR